MRLVIFHGWSDHSANFQSLARHLSKTLQRDVTLIDLADWVSLDDDVTFEDLETALDRAWRGYNLPLTGRQVDVVTHSTGALLIRHWLVNRIAADTDSPPIKRFLQLAPANFGSPIAHYGRSIVGRARAGFQVASGTKRNRIRRAFETGTQLLYGLELASPYTWDLAERDRFGPHASLYGPGRILTTTLIGNEGDVFVVEVDGSDGVVRTSTANMNTAQAKIQFRPNPAPGQLVETFHYSVSPNTSAFRIANGFDHGDIVLNGRISKKPRGVKPKTLGCSEVDVLEWMRRALTVEDGDYEGWRAECAAATHSLTKELNRYRDDEVHGHMSLVVRVRNQFGQPVNDYALELYNDDDFDANGRFKGLARNSLTKRLRRQVIRQVHKHRLAPHQRCLHIDCGAFHDKITPHLKHGLYISVTATPLFDEEKKVDSVGYRTLDDEDIGHALIPKQRLKEIIVPHQTLFLDIQIEKEQGAQLVKFGRAPR